MLTFLTKKTYEILPRDKIIIYGLSGSSLVAGIALFALFSNFISSIEASTRLSPDVKRMLTFISVLLCILATVLIALPIITHSLQFFDRLPRIMTSINVHSGIYIVAALLMSSLLLYMSSIIPADLSEVKISPVMFGVSISYLFIVLGIFTASKMLDKSTLDKIRQTVFGRTSLEKVTYGIGSVTGAVGGAVGGAVRSGFGAVGGAVRSGFGAVGAGFGRAIDKITIPKDYPLTEAQQMRKMELWANNQ
jgi:hypothetical protein